MNSFSRTDQAMSDCKHARPSMRSCLLACLLAGTFVACSSGPDPTYESKAKAVNAWSGKLEYGLNTDKASLSGWWKNLNDPKLNDLVERAIDQNLDLKVAMSRVREARQSTIKTKAGFLPSASAGGSLERTEASTSVDGFTLPDSTQDTGSLGLDASWEIDLFGRVASSVDAAEADLAATVESHYDAQITLLGEVARNYVQLRMYQERVRLANANINAQKRTYELTKTRHDLALASELELRQVEANVANSESTVPPLESGVAQSMNRLAVLLGEAPGALNKELAEPKPVPATPGEIAVGVPADVIRRRPDIRQAERRLAAASARVGVARADLYPRLKLNGSLAFQATDAANMFSLLTRSLSFGPSFQWNVFSGGSVRANIKIRQEQQEQALLNYEKTMLSALEEVENAMVAYAKEFDRRERLRQAAEASGRAVELSRDLYREGVKDLLNVLHSERGMFDQQDRFAQSEAEMTLALVRMYKALGGGWEPIREPVPQGN